MTKEQLFKQFIEREQMVLSLKENEQNRKNNEILLRKEFAKAFNWHTTKLYGNESEPLEPSWSQIFVQIGKLLQKEKNVDIEIRIGELTSDVAFLSQQLNKKELE